MPKWITYTIRVMLVLILILFVIAGMWYCETRNNSHVMSVEKAFKDMEDYPGWTEEEQQQIIERRNYLKKCEAFLNELDEEYGE